MTPRFRPQPGSRRRGSVMVEFALSFTTLFAVFASMFQFGYAFYNYNRLVNAVKTGARYAANKPYSSTNTVPTLAFLQDVRNMVVYGMPHPPEGTAPIVAGLTPDKVQLSITGKGAGTAFNPNAMTPPDLMTVSITSFPIRALFMTTTLNNRPRATFPYTGILTPP